MIKKKVISGIITMGLILVNIHLSANRIIDFKHHAIPDSIFVDNNHIIIGEGFSLSIYNKDSYKLITKFGKKGEGPGEFKSLPLVNIKKKHLMINSNSKVSFFSNKGEFIKETSHISSGIKFVPVGTEFIGYKSFSDKKGKRYSAINLYNNQFKKTKTIYKNVSISQSQTGKGWRLFQKTYITPLVCKNRIITAGEVDFIINIYNFEGNNILTIKQPYKRVKFTDQFKNRVLNLYKTRPSTAPDYPFWKKNIIFPEYFPAIRKIYTTKKHIYVRTYRSKENRSEFFIFDPNGKLIKHIFLPIAESYKKYPYPFLSDSSPFTFFDKKLYQLRLDEETETIFLEVININL